MRLTDLFKIISRNWFMLIALPAVTAASIFFFVKDQKELYTSSTTVYTGIATGYDLSNSNSQHSTATNAFANLISIIDSKDIKKEVGFNLLASHLMLKSPDITVLSESNYAKLQEAIPATLKSKLVGATLEETIRNIKKYYYASANNELRMIMNSDEFGYSEEALESIVAQRIGDSDLLKITYTSSDPALSKNTLDILTKEFIKKERSLYTAKSESVVKYFEEATAKALQKLKIAESNLQAFQQSNNVIDYNSQVETTVSEKDKLLEKYNDMDIEYTGAVANLKSIESKLKDRGLTNLHSQQVLQQKNRLAKISNQIAEIELLEKGKSNSANLNALKQEAEDLSRKMLRSVDQHYANTQTAEGLPTAGLLEDWVKTTILVEELKNKLRLVDKQKQAYAQEYNKLLPLGTVNKKVVREVALAEQEYLAQLDGLKQSKLNQQNFELISQLQVVDPPQFPSSPANNTRLLLMIFGALGVFFLTLGGLVARSLFDQTLRKPSIALRKIQYPVFGVLPSTSSSSPKHLQLAQNAEDQLARQLILKMKHRNSPGPFVVGVLSSKSGEGKTALCNALATNLNMLGVDTQILYPDNHRNSISPDNQSNFYSPLQGVLTDASVEDIAGFELYNSSIILVEFPAVLEETYPVSLLKHLDLVLLTVRANRVWQQADKAIIESIKQVTTAPIEIVLSSVQPDDAKEIVISSSKYISQEQKLLQSPKNLPALETT